MLYSSPSVPETAHDSAPISAERMNGASHALRSEDIAVICHELRNSLAVVSSAARLLRSAEGSVVNTARSLIERQVDFMARHIGDLLPPTHNGHDHGLQRSHIDLRAIARNAAAAIGPEMERRGHRLALKLPSQPIWADADAARLEQAVSNLLINAAKYTPDGGDIALTMERDHERLCVRVRDTGIGIESAMLTHVFGLFVRVGNGMPLGLNGSGSGIGLAVVQDIVESHGGTVKAASPGLGQGSEFTIMRALRRT